MNKKVRFRGEEYWLTSSDFCDGLISPISHFSEDGELLASPFDISYAAISGNDIVRFGMRIGDISELEDV